MNFITKLVSKIFSNISLRTLLVVLFVIQISTAVTLTGYLSYVNGQKAVNDLATQLQNELAGRIHQHLHAYLETPHLLNKNHLAAIQLGMVQLNDSLMLGHFFWKQLQVFESVSTIYFGNEQGGIIVARRQDSGFTIEETKDFTAGDLFIYQVDKEGNRSNLLKTEASFDSRVRPWYQSAVKAGNAVWTEMFSIYARQELGIAACLPIYEEKNNIRELKGVLTTQLVVSQVNEFLESLQIGKTGKTFIIERSGSIVASSTKENPFTIDKKTNVMKRMTASESSIPLISHTAKHIYAKFSDLRNIDTAKQFTFQLDGQRQYLHVSPLNDKHGLDWLIVVAVPEADFMERINANTRMTIALSLTALVLATLIGILTAHWIIKPILNLTHAAYRLANGRWEEILPVDRKDELGVLANSFNRMAAQLQESFHTLENKSSEIQHLNSDLEQRVLQRTADLNAKIQELVQTRNELLQSEKMASLGRLVAGFAHEINTPIGVAVGAASTLQEIARSVLKMFEQEEVDEEELLTTIESLEEAADLTLSNLRRATRLVSSFKRTAVDQSSEVLRLFNVKETVEDVNNSLHNKFKHTQIKIMIDCPESLLVFGLPGILDQVLTNLMMNSFHHGFDDGHSPGTITISISKMEPNLHIEYVDTGKGMNQEVLEKIFEPFFTTRRGRGGSGLGMYLCYNLVTSQLRGTISCQSAPGQGVRFFIDYPIKQDTKREISAT